MPVATSQRVMPVKVIEENRRLINAASRKHFLHAPDCVGDRQGARKSPGAESGVFAKIGERAFRITRDHVNLGIAVDVAGKDGARSLKVPIDQERAGDGFRAIPRRL